MNGVFLTAPRAGVPNTDGEDAGILHPYRYVGVRRDYDTRDGIRAGNLENELPTVPHPQPPEPLEVLPYFPHRSPEL